MFSLKNTVIGLLTLMAAFFGGTKAYVDHQIEQQLNQFTQSAGQKIQLDYTNASLSWTGDMVINQVTVQAENQPKIAIEKVVLHQAYMFYDVKNSLPEQLQLELFGVKIDVPDAASNAPAILSSYKPYYLSLRELRQLGFPQFAMDIDIQAKQAANHLDLLIDVQGQRWANLNIATTLLNVPQSPLQWSKQAKQIQLEQFILTYNENSLFQKTSTFLARRNQQPENIFTQQLAYKLRRDIESLRTELETNSIENLAQFIQQPKQLQLILQPEPPFPTYQTVINTHPLHLVQQLGFKINYLP
ncbi:hypothetical protein [Candidatus Albibeggiatoa sp. nov. NOAA]|uniref:hypothetical protein n=1 Tax=Candidatus Albibeggiatoa sp. nov. NOAA TaxID=3162724 RepID=UPI0032FCA737|nr:hypothetical protein [Thiotrichaceae bacterium]